MSNHVQQFLEDEGEVAGNGLLTEIPPVLMFKN